MEVKMPVHVVIKRKFKMNQPEKLFPLLSELNNLAKTQEGYISTETLQSTENSEDYLVISKWETEENWDTWHKRKERREIQGRIDSLIGERTFYEIFKPTE
jgi:heme-degrading monooxygenase HmoA